MSTGRVPPDMSTGAWVLVAALTAALALGLYRAYADGRFRGTHPVRGAATAASVSSRHPELARLVDDGVLALGERATLLQFSSAFCAPCRATRRVLADVASTVPGVTHHELDAEHHLDVVRRLGVLRTPTTLVLDAHGLEVARAAGAPTRAQVLGQLGSVV